MAVRQEELEGHAAAAVVYRFPIERARPEVARVRRRIARRRAERRRRRAGIVAIVLSIVALTLLGGGQGATSRADSQSLPETVVVQPGDTLWDVAASIAPEGADPRVYLEALIEANEIAGPIYPGMRLRVP